MWRKVRKLFRSKAGKACDAKGGKCASKPHLNGKSERKRNWLVRIWHMIRRKKKSETCKVDPVDEIDARKPIVHPTCGWGGA
jgi:hypothetical protein